MILQPPLADAVRVFGVTLVGVSTTTAVKLAFTLGLVVVIARFGRWRWASPGGCSAAKSRTLVGSGPAKASRLWPPCPGLGVVSIWVTPTTDITTGVGLISAGLAFALQQVITSLAAYFVILRGDTFGVGDRITLGGVRGDVIRLGFLKTTIMEMGQPPSVADTDPAVWVNSRQYTGRIVTVTNGVSSTSRCTTTRATSPTCGRRSCCRSAYAADRAEAERPARRGTCPRRRRRPRGGAGTCGDARRYALADAALTRRCTGGSPTTGWNSPCGSWSPHRGVRDIKDRMAVTSWSASTPPASASPRPPTTLLVCPACGSTTVPTTRGPSRNDVDRTFRSFRTTNPVATAIKAARAPVHRGAAGHRGGHQPAQGTPAAVTGYGD